MYHFHTVYVYRQGIGAGAFGGNGTAGVDFSQAYLDITYSRSLGENFTWGVSLVAVAQVFAARGF